MKCYIFTALARVTQWVIYVVSPPKQKKNANFATTETNCNDTNIVIIRIKSISIDCERNIEKFENILQIRNLLPILDSVRKLLLSSCHFRLMFRHTIDIRYFHYFV